jgi:alkanesulfonate monooxygenase
VSRTPLNLDLKVFSTCPQSTDGAPGTYLDRVIDVARWSERAGCSGILVYTDNSLVDPWLVSQVIIQHTGSLCPLVAVQPVYMHPYAVAKIVATFGFFYHRRLYLNMVAGGFKNDLNSLNDATPHDRRYDRLIEYTNLIKRLLSSEQAVTHTGEFYQVKQLKVIPFLPPDLAPGIFVSGSSEAGVAAAHAIGATCVEYPLLSTMYGEESNENELEKGIRVGIIARPKDDDAWRVARVRFPIDRKGQLTHQLAMKISDSKWHQLLSDAAKDNVAKESPYWLEPFLNYKTFCPYLVGSYEVVAQEIAQYIRAGCRAVILDIPTEEEELDHIGVVFQQARALAQ